MDRGSGSLDSALNIYERATVSWRCARDDSVLLGFAVADTISVTPYRQAYPVSTTDLAAYSATVPTTARPRSCCRWRGAWPRGSSRLPTARASFRREGMNYRQQARRN